MTDTFPEARRWVDDYATTTGGAKAYVAHQLANAAAGLLAKVDELHTQLTDSRTERDSAELAETRAQRDLNSDLLDGAAKALGMDLTDPDVHYAYEIPTKVAELVADRDGLIKVLAKAIVDLNETTAALAKSREQAANLANENGRLVSENARVRQQRDDLKAVVEAVRVWRESSDVQTVGLDDEGMALVDAYDAYEIDRTQAVAS
ncbi:hypothetical protein [Micromonospora chokoriensis]|uniref:hypothetical protein n=1 Tax=Micromonospora chokoriensis TaxID=356851 RepID=UPI0004C32202|nr:hypothetical protein [Micromonospora chokoriensis]